MHIVLRAALPGLSRFRHLAPNGSKVLQRAKGGERVRPNRFKNR